MAMDDVCQCGCCDAPGELPLVRYNAPSLPAISYRVGTHTSFKASLLAALSTSAHPALLALRTRRDDDFSIAACDAAATLLDVLTFYQERFANEFYLRTATERRSILELARLIGYHPSPGVAAGTRLTFLLEDAPGAPALAAKPVTISAGTRVQSVPGPGEEPRTFETTQAVTARVEWNAIPVQTSARQAFPIGTTDLFLGGVNVQVQSGDVVLIVGDERIESVASDNWDARVVETVERDSDRGVTRVTWKGGLGQVSPVVEPAAKRPRAFVFRQRVALFGHNAPDPHLLFQNGTVPAGMTDFVETTLKWKKYAIEGEQIDLDNSYPKVLAKSWLLLAGGTGDSLISSLPGLVELYRIDSVKHLSRSGYGLSSRITRVDPDTSTNLTNFSLTDTVALAQSEELPLAERPLTYPLFGAEVALQVRSPHLVSKQEVAISGKRPRLRVVLQQSGLAFVPTGSAWGVALKDGDSFVMAAAPTALVSGQELAVTPAELGTLLKQTGTTMRWRVIDRDGRTGSIDAPPAAFDLQAPLDRDAVVEEVAVVAAAAHSVVHDRDRTTLHLRKPLANVYDRRTTTVCANVAPATDGETVSEIAGSGNAAIPGQHFLLKQSPLTYVSSPTPTGRESTLDVRVDGLLWREVETLFEQPPNAHVYALRHDEEARTIVQFGDGVEGARTSSGQDNIRFTYRKSLGAAGNLPVGRLTTLLGRPLGVKAVTNSVPATGGDDPESRDAARGNAPLTVLTLGRAVSLQDYSHFARSFAGIAKAHATWLGRGPARRMSITVAGAGGAPIPDDSDTISNLISSLRQYGDRLVPLTVQSYTAVTFRVAARLKVMAAALPEDVRRAVEQALRAAYAFEARNFGDSVSLDEVMAVIHSVRGVEAADVDELYRMDLGPPGALKPRLFSRPAQLQTNGSVAPAEILTLDAGPVELGVMP